MTPAKGSEERIEEEIEKRMTETVTPCPKCGTKIMQSALNPFLMKEFIIADLAAQLGDCKIKELREQIAALDEAAKGKDAEIARLDEHKVWLHNRIEKLKSSRAQADEVIQDMLIFTDADYKLVGGGITFHFQMESILKWREKAKAALKDGESQ